MSNEIELTKNKKLAIAITLLTAIPTASLYIGEATKNPMLIITAALTGATTITIALFLAIWIIIGNAILKIKKRRHKQLDYWSTRKPRKRPSP